MAADTAARKMWAEVAECRAVWMRFEEHLKDWEAKELVWLMKEPKSEPDATPFLGRMLSEVCKVAAVLA
jgi:hypothetical protein